MNDEFLTREQTLAPVDPETVRDYLDNPDSVSFIAYVTNAQDYCRCEWVKIDGNWEFSFQILPDDERLEREVVTDERIASVALSGGKITAVRMYRTKYGASLSDALKAVDEMMKASSELPAG